ncbi:MAG: 16S rRNA (cytidine(1402)-2'-O)-methyltransferase [Anaerolineae bacterium]|nr:16S rRNA (cytidine(1402)-2'-O)-methyltransferase [Thermoflexales bacterium]MDW8394943.1 16S rRNA (cytidine(1402)-2'-O)-methyltransferase [Anaerolineae bacterium]
MLYLVATPIGNLSDLSQRAIETLRSADVIASEDTRHTGLLLARLGIQRPQLSLHEYNEPIAVERIVQRLRAGQTVAMVTDAGTPGISDPGFVLVRRCIEEQLPFTMVPGPTAFVVALVLSGLPVHSFTFRGFPPRRQNRRRRFLEVDRDSPHTLIFYESPLRVAALIEDALAVLGDRRAALARELTKQFEQVLRGQLSELLAQVRSQPLRGECVLVVEGKTDALNAAQDETEI